MRKAVALSLHILFIFIISSTQTEAISITSFSASAAKNLLELLHLQQRDTQIVKRLNDTTIEQTKNKGSAGDQEALVEPTHN